MEFVYLLNVPEQTVDPITNGTTFHPVSISARWVSTTILNLHVPMTAKINDKQKSN
jgi:hypothetical protein